MKARYAQGCFPHINAFDRFGASPRHGLGQQAATATHVEQVLSGNTRVLINPAGSEGVNLMKRLELRVGIPPARCKGFKFRDFCRINIGWCGHER